MFNLHALLFILLYLCPSSTQNISSHEEHGFRFRLLLPPETATKMSSSRVVARGQRSHFLNLRLVVVCSCFLIFLSFFQSQTTVMILCTSQSESSLHFIDFFILSLNNGNTLSTCSCKLFIFSHFLSLHSVICNNIRFCLLRSLFLSAVAALASWDHFFLYHYFFTSFIVVLYSSLC